MSCDLSAFLGLDSGDPDQLVAALQQCTDALEDPVLWFWAIAFTVVGAVGGAYIGKYKNAVARDALLGAALGPVGWLVSLLLPVRKPPARCPACKGKVEAGDAHCRHCGVKLAAA